METTKRKVHAKPQQHTGTYFEIKCGIRPDQKAWLVKVRPGITASALLRTAIDNKRKAVEKFEKYRGQVDQMKAKIPKEALEYFLAKK